VARLPAMVKLLESQYYNRLQYQCNRLQYVVHECYDAVNSCLEARLPD